MPFVFETKCLRDAQIIHTEECGFCVLFYSKSKATISDGSI